jgi:alpha-galactosidase
MVEIKHTLFRLSFPVANDSLWTYQVGESGSIHDFMPPIFEIDGKTIQAMPERFDLIKPARVLPNGCTEYHLGGILQAEKTLSLHLFIRTAPDNPVVRFCYRLYSTSEHHLTKANGVDSLIYTTLGVEDACQLSEVTLSEFNELTHAYGLQERPLDQPALEAGATCAGPILVAERTNEAWLLAYEHGSNLPNTYVQFRFAMNQGKNQVSIEAVKGNYYHGKILDFDHPFTTLWLQFAAIPGNITELATAYRSFILDHFSLYASRSQPYIFYNTWNFQERNKHWYGKPYLESMNEGRMLAEIEIAHRLGIDVFVIDTGWYARTGDWQVDYQRFPHGLAPIKEKLDQWGMCLGLWFSPCQAAVSSQIHNRFRECVFERDGKESHPLPVWETEASRYFCLVSDYADGFADELIRLNRELGVTYFKWDAVSQETGCSSPNHWHGSIENSAEERAVCYEFELVRALCQIAEKVCEACPEAIVDLDLTESGRSLGLAFLATGKYFLINNGPYYANYDHPSFGTNENLFFFPGTARATLCRNALAYDRWIPSVLFLTHFFPDETPATTAHWALSHGKSDFQEVNLASLILGGNGIWGDLLTISANGIERVGEVLDQYKRVRDAITHAAPVRSGSVGGSPEIHEKINHQQGVVVVFSPRRGSYTYRTHHPVGKVIWHNAGVDIINTPDNHAILRVKFNQPGAKIIFFA